MPEQGTKKPAYDAGLTEKERGSGAKNSAKRNATQTRSLKERAQDTRRTQMPAEDAGTRDKEGGNEKPRSGERGGISERSDAWSRGHVITLSRGVSELRYPERCRTCHPSR